MRTSLPRVSIFVVLIVALAGLPLLAQAGAQTTLASPDTPVRASPEVRIVEEGWSDDLAPVCSSSGDCWGFVAGYHYRLYESTNYPCGTAGNHEFLVVDRGEDPGQERGLFAKFLGGGVGFWYTAPDGQGAYWPQANGIGVEYASQNRNMLFRASLSDAYAQGVTRRFRGNESFRMVVVSYCSHDLYHGRGEFAEPESNARWGYSAAMQAVDYVLEHFATDGLVTYGGSAGAAGAFFVGVGQDADAIVMDSQAVDISAMRDACDAGTNVFGNAYPCFSTGPNSYDVVAERIGFEMGVDEPYLHVADSPPIYLVWNERDASRYAFLQYDRLHEAIEADGRGLARKVCVKDPLVPGDCNLHVPSGRDYENTGWLVEDIYTWALQRIIVPTATPLPTETLAPTQTSVPTATPIPTPEVIQLQPGVMYSCPTCPCTCIPTDTTPTPTHTPSPAPSSTATATSTSTRTPPLSATATPVPVALPRWGSMLVRSWPGDRTTTYDVLATAQGLGLDGMVATGAPSADIAPLYAYLDGWERLFLRGPFASLASIDATARRFGVPYTCIGYGPESSHQAGEEALDPLTWVPRAEALAESFGKCLVYGPAVMDWELRIAPDQEAGAALVAQVAPHVDIWMVQLGSYERWAKAGRTDAGELFSYEALYERVAWWHAAIAAGNPNTRLWVQAGVGQTSGGVCLDPQPAEELLAHRRRLGAVGVDGLFVMPSQICQNSADPQDHEMYLRSLEAFQQAVILSAGE